jgi:hypothetical protein
MNTVRNVGFNKIRGVSGLADKEYSTLLHGNSYFGRFIFYVAEKLVTLGIDITSITASYTYK